MISGKGNELKFVKEETLSRASNNQPKRKLSHSNIKRVCGNTRESSFSAVGKTIDASEAQGMQGVANAASSGLITML